MDNTINPEIVSAKIEKFNEIMKNNYRKDKAFEPMFLKIRLHNNFIEPPEDNFFNFKFLSLENDNSLSLEEIKEIKEFSLEEKTNIKDEYILAYAFSSYSDKTSIATYYQIMYDNSIYFISDDWHEIELVENKTMAELLKERKEEKIY